jgi:hypothetical protein
MKVKNFGFFKLIFNELKKLVVIEMNADVAPITTKATMKVGLRCWIRRKKFSIILSSKLELKETQVAIAIYMKIPINQIRRKKKYPKGSLLLPEFLLFGKNDFIKDKCKLREEFRFYQSIE